MAFGDDFKTIKGKEYKNVTVSRVEADGIVIKTKTGLSKIYFVELPKDVQKRFRYGSATPTGKAVTQVIDGQSFADKFAERVQKKARRAGSDLTRETHARPGRVERDT